MPKQWFEEAGERIGGKRPFDIRVHDRSNVRSYAYRHLKAMLLGWAGRLWNRQNRALSRRVIYRHYNTEATTDCAAVMAL